MSNSSCDLCDLHKSTIGSTLHVLPPIFKSFGGRPAIVGLVSTVKCFEDNSLVRSALDEAGDGRILVVDGGGSLRRALVGGNVATAAAKNGWAGLVVHGAVRDRAELAVLPIGVFALALIPLPTDKRDEGRRDVPVQIAGVWIRPGDRLVADADGIVVLPA